ncbi:MAG TPA: RNA polymerase sigma factor [Pyrinomonadaceae bacterium]|jgi:RNA polymerase sigma-70 factor (ECF subfamily)|nr:RNA polymerase sigma factor [Pyrinomonadaceae bacterium]
MTGGLNWLMNLKNDLSDTELLRSMLAGDEEALTILYRRRQAGIYRFAMQMSGSKPIAEDVTQEVFLFLMREGHVFDPARGSVSAFLFGVARNLVLRRLRVEQLLAPLGDDSDEDGPMLQAAGDLCPLEDLTRAETIESVRKAVLSLPAKYREVVVLCELQDVSYGETAEILGCAIGTVRSRLHRARALLLAKLRPAGEFEEAGSATVKSARCFA